MENEKIVEIIEAEEQKLVSLKEKRIKLDLKIKQKQALIGKHKSLLEQKKFNEATDVLSASNLTLDEVMTAIRQGNISSLQEKINKSSR